MLNQLNYAVRSVELKDTYKIVESGFDTFVLTHVLTGDKLPLSFFSSQAANTHATRKGLIIDNT